jgi:hypothetical protein
VRSWEDGGSSDDIGGSQIEMSEETSTIERLALSQMPENDAYDMLCYAQWTSETTFWVKTCIYYHTVFLPARGQLAWPSWLSVGKLYEIPWQSSQLTRSSGRASASRSGGPIVYPRWTSLRAAALMSLSIGSRGSRGRAVLC